MRDPIPPSADTSRRMASIRTRDTAAEMALRRELHGRGLRYFVDEPIPGVRRTRADIVFPTRKVAIFVDGCFWHRCPDHATDPKTNAAWWQAKLDRNFKRDRDTDVGLRELGWTVIRIWEHEDPCDAAARIEVLVRAQGTDDA